ncbi:MAG: prepilin-type N-terminal cleavage/methylation domain-containing protein [Candidatus Omnitrophica bacterium]|nr:prepilin-type N-terminal cleavage/methylation domain-containing protein [Candidatus Omnitrophota bacterium]
MDARSNNKKGFGLIEIIVSVFIITSVFSAFYLFYQKALYIEQRSTMFIQANLLLEEGVEVVKLFRDDSWQNNIVSLSTSTSYYLNFTGTTWEATTTEILIDPVFDRTVVFEDVFRDGNDDIDPSGTHATGTLKLTVQVEWLDRGATTSQSVQTYIADIFDN